MSLIGRRLSRREDTALLTSGGSYVADASQPDGASAYLGFVRSSLAHARILAVDAGPALAFPGVLGVYTATDLSLAAMPPILPNFPPELSPAPLARDRVRYVGEPIVAVLVERPSHLEDAMELIDVRLEPLPAVVDPNEALRDEILLFPELGSNVVGRRESGLDASVNLFEGCEVVVADTIVVPRVAPCPLEARGSISWWDEDGRLHHQTSTQAPHTVKVQLQQALGLASDTVHVLVGDVGGSFGAKANCCPEEVLAAELARRVGRTVHWAESRSESMVALHHGRGQILEVTIGGTREGRILAYRVDITQDAGAYADLGVYAIDPTIRMATGVYDIARVRATGRAVVTNTTPVTAYRGTGRPEAACAIEWALDLFSSAVDRDPVEVRRANMIREFPSTTGVGTTYDQGDYDCVLNLAVDASGYHELRAEQARRRSEGANRLLGVGVCVYVESAGAGPPSEYARIHVRGDGTVQVATGTSPHGQGHATCWSMIAAEILGVPLERISVIFGDTDQVSRGAGTFASRSLQIGGSAVRETAVKLVERGRRLASQLLEAEITDLVFDPERGLFHVAGAPAVTCSWSDVAAASGGRGILETCNFQGSVTYPFGAHVAVVEIDGETGDTRLMRLVSVDDAGRLLNPLIAEGQRHGAIAQGVAEMLYEEFRYAPDGTPLTVSWADYALISAAEVPCFELITSETPTSSNALGAMGIGENGTIGALAAVHGAVADAVAHLGIGRIPMPATPERVWLAIRRSHLSKV